MSTTEELSVGPDLKYIPLAIHTSNEDDEVSLETGVSKKSMINAIFTGKLPKSFGFIIGNEFCERFCFYGMKAVLTLYLKEFIGTSNVVATNIYHMFTFLAYFMPICGAILSDSWLGRFRTILYLSLVYVFGTALMSILAIPSVGHKNLGGVVTALIIIAIGTGGIKPCVSSFGADQFEGETAYLEVFFNAFYMAINAGSLLSLIATPLLKGVNCLQPENDPDCSLVNCACYALAFGIPAILMVVAIALFLAGSRMYIKVPPQGSMLLKFIMSMLSACKNKIKGSKPSRIVRHWLDNADNHYDCATLDDFKQVLSVIVLFAPLCVFWTLYDQTGSTWIIQGTMMNHLIGGWNLTPDLIQAINPIMVLILVPFFDSIVYPFLARFKFLTTSLQRMLAGMLFAALAFVVAGFIQIAIVHELKSNSNMTANATMFASSPYSEYVLVHNSLSCSVNVYESANGETHWTIEPDKIVQVKKSELIGNTLNSTCTNGITFTNNVFGLELSIQSDSRNNIIATKFEPRYSDQPDGKTSIHILYQLIQYFILSIGEILFSISGLHFAYSEAPISMKSVMTAIWLLTNSIGNIITVIINTAVGDRSHEVWLFFLYAGLIVVVDGIFFLLVRNYIPREQRMKETEIALRTKSLNFTGMDEHQK